MAAPIMAIDTIIQGVLRLPVKNVELSLLREAKDEIKNNNAKYPSIVKITITGVMVYRFYSA